MLCIFEYFTKELSHDVRNIIIPGQIYSIFDVFHTKEKESLCVPNAKIVKTHCKSTTVL